MKKKINELHDSSWLYEMYIERGYSCTRIAKMLGCYHHPVLVALRRNGIEVRPHKREFRPKELDDRKWLEAQYRTKPTTQIAKELNCSSSAVQLAMKRFDIETREPGRQRGPECLDDKDWLIEIYKTKNTHQVAKILECSQVTVWKAFIKFGIKLQRRRKSAYKYIKDTDGKSKAEHRAIMEKLLGRPLQLNEVVHHINGDKNNNDPTNLAVMEKSAHYRLHFNGRDRICVVCSAPFKGNRNAKYCSKPCHPKSKHIV